MQNDKTYMWLTIITFIGLTVGLAVGFIHMQDYKGPKYAEGVSENPFK